MMIHNVAFQYSVDSFVMAFYSQIFRLNKRLAEAETMTYEVIRDLLGVKSDLTAHNVRAYILCLCSRCA